MTADKPSNLVPKLRFPEFIGQELHDVRLGEVTEESMARNGSRLPPASVMGVRKEDGIVPMEERLVATDISRYKLVRSNWFAYNPMRLNIGSIARWQGDSVVLVSPDYVVFRCLEQSTPAALHPEYLDHFRSSSQWDAFVNEAGDGGVRVRIYYRDISQLRLIVPDVVEQQKIADCLGSLDDLIAAEGRKLEALRRHKQGLMQQLFPQPGETVPRLRFPEFRVDTTWLAPQLSDLYSFKRTNTLSRDNLNYEFGTIRNIHYGDIHTKFKPLFRLENEHVPYVNLDVAPDGFDDDAFCVEGDIVLADASEDLDDVGKAIEVVSLTGERVVAGTHTILATRRGSVPVVGFGGQLFQSAAVRTGIKREAQGAKVYGISANRISAIRVPVPPTEAEQQRIATCLSSLEDVLAAQARKIDALKQQKQGLLQQLFPSLETE